MSFFKLEVRRLAVVVLALLIFASPSFAQSDRVGSNGSGVFLFGGVMTDGDFESNLLFVAPPRDGYLVGMAYSHEFSDLGLSFHLGGEIGVAARFDDGTSAEFWAGPSLRHEGVRIGPVRVSFGLVAGWSVVTNSTGLERTRELASGGDATLLYYVGPEIGFVLDAFPDVEFVLRSHHRSGGRYVSPLPTLGDMSGATNSTIVGVRKRF